ncbi:ribbon-helix-helix protein, CopG family [Mesorhizobium sp. KR9-304]|uniref:plasmid mobilization protein n=1 Tax=Mesorhizobium sp. KR9-304 TaxID=3156614 RepID=UPI0032B332C2
MRFSEPIDGRIKVRVSRDEKAALATLARERGMTLSDLLRDGAKAFADRVAA